MRIGIIAEGHSDRAVIENIIIGITGLDTSDFIPIRPQYDYDATDMAIKNPNTFSNWSIVREECISRDKIEFFLGIEEQDFVVIHIDTAECSEYGVTRPVKGDNYCELLRAAVKDKIDEWLEGNFTEQILHAIAVEETDAWILAIYENVNSEKYSRPKEKLKKVLGKRRINSSTTYDNYLLLSELLSKPRAIKKGEYLLLNCSLRLFYEEVQTKVKIP